MALAPAVSTSPSSPSVRLGEGSVGLVKMITALRHTHVPEDIDCNIDLEIGAFCSIASGLVIVSGQHPSVDHPLCVSNFPFSEGGWGAYPPCRDGLKVVIGSDVWIGQNVTIMEGVKVGHGAILAAGAVVARDVDPYTVVAGNPARFVKIRFSPGVVEELLRVAWWEWPDDQIKGQLRKMADVTSFLHLPHRSR